MGPLLIVGILLLTIVLIPIMLSIGKNQLWDRVPTWVLVSLAVLAMALIIWPLIATAPP